MTIYWNLLIQALTIQFMKIVVLGGNGFVGSAICKAAVSKGIEVVSVSRSLKPFFSNKYLCILFTFDIFHLILHLIG